MFKHTVIPLILVCSTSVLADHRRDSVRHTQYAQVTHVQAIYERISYTRPTEQCWREEAVVHERSSSAPIFGAIIGGALGNELGHHKSNKRVGAVVGAVLGATVAADVSRGRGGSHYETIDRCETQHHQEWREEVVGYDVSYRYQGEIYHTRLPYNPGREIEIEVNITPRG
ncbi:glycine zipper 2TM domain-containing protein [uncultured Zhongshania sp.]|uniref:glycine zipper 2TM domain-containing protein n=1 Tax=uncultured Zhongshania sp. TaxID=1642288 RepID=UPI0030D82C44|tara:strand:- start:626 stop:1138 length:513 start_codon:yes stop_codon:yes gene_type:complete